MRLTVYRCKTCDNCIEYFERHSILREALIQSERDKNDKKSREILDLLRGLRRDYPCRYPIEIENK